MASNVLAGQNQHCKTNTYTGWCCLCEGKEAQYWWIKIIYFIFHAYFFKSKTHMQKRHLLAKLTSLPYSTPYAFHLEFLQFSYKHVKIQSAKQKHLCLINYILQLDPKDDYMQDRIPSLESISCHTWQHVLAINYVTTPSIEFTMAAV